jgi:hypothetical protein
MLLADATQRIPQRRGLNPKPKPEPLNPEPPPSGYCSRVSPHELHMRRVACS